MGGTPAHAGLLLDRAGLSRATCSWSRLSRVLTATTFAMLLLDRYLGFHFFYRSTASGNPMMYVNLFWVWGHPEVYILILPAFGIFSEVISTFLHASLLFGYRSMVAATMVICVLSFIVWLHHFFTMGAGADVGFFGVVTMIIAVPTGVKVFS